MASASSAAIIKKAAAWTLWSEVRAASFSAISIARYTATATNSFCIGSPPFSGGIKKAGQLPNGKPLGLLSYRAGGGVSDLCGVVQRDPAGAALELAPALGGAGAGALGDDGVDAGRDRVLGDAVVGAGPLADPQAGRLDADGVVYCRGGCG